jgi:hypothetical protein
MYAKLLGKLKKNRILILYISALRNSMFMDKYVNIIFEIAPLTVLSNLSLKMALVCQNV